MQDAGATGVLRCLKHSPWLHLQIEGTWSPGGGGGDEEEEEGSAVLNRPRAEEIYGVLNGILLDAIKWRSSSGVHIYALEKVAATENWHFLLMLRKQSFARGPIWNVVSIQN